MSTYVDYFYISDLITDPVCDALSLPSLVCADADFGKIQDWTDVVTCREFEGHEMPWSFTEETYHLMH